MRTSSNPAFRNLPVGGAAGGPYAGFNQSQAGVPGYGAPRTAQGADERPMTVDDVVMKTGACIGTALLTGTVTAVWAHSQLAAGTTGGIFLALIGGMLVGLGLALFISFKQKTSPALILGYSAAEGVFLGAVTAVFESMLPASASGLALQAILGTGIVFVTMLVVYKTGAVKVTPKLRKWVIGAAAAAFGLILINLLLSFFGVDLGVRGNGPLGIIIGIVFIGIAAFMLLLDFDMADTMIRQGMPQRFAWLAAFGLMTTLVWLYFEMVRLLWALQSE